MGVYEQSFPELLTSLMVCLKGFLKKILRSSFERSLLHRRFPSSPELDTSDVIDMDCSPLLTGRERLFASTKASHRVGNSRIHGIRMMGSLATLRCRFKSNGMVHIYILR